MPSVINIQMDTVSTPAAVIVQAPPQSAGPAQDMRPTSPQQKELRLPVALEQALAFKTERAKQLGVKPEELGIYLCYVASETILGLGKLVQ